MSSAVGTKCDYAVRPPRVDRSRAGLLLVAVGVGQAAEAVAAGAAIDGLTVAFVGGAALACYAPRRRQRSSGHADRTRSRSEQ